MFDSKPFHKSGQVVHTHVSQSKTVPA